MIFNYLMMGKRLIARHYDINGDTKSKIISIEESLGGNKFTYINANNMAADLRLAISLFCQEILLYVKSLLPIL